MEIGNVTGSSITKNKDGDEDVLLVQTTITDEDDAQNAEVVTQSGEDSRPLTGAVVFIMELSDSDKYILGVDDGVVPVSEPGAKEFYALEQGDPPTKVVRLKLLADGNLEIECNENIKLFPKKNVQIKGILDNAVRFAPLNIAIGGLQTQINALNTVISANNALFNTHIHPPPGPVGARPPNVTFTDGTPIVVSIAAAKVNTVTMPNVAEDIET